MRILVLVCLYMHVTHAYIPIHCVFAQETQDWMCANAPVHVQAHVHMHPPAHTHTHTNLASRSPSHPGSQAKVCKPLCLGRSPYDQVTWLLTRRIYLAILLCYFYVSLWRPMYVVCLAGEFVDMHMNASCLNVCRYVRACVPACLPAWLLGCPAYEAYVGRKEKVDGQARKRERAKERQVTVVNYCTLTECAALWL